MTLSEQEKEAIKQAQREYKAEWRKKNKDKVKAANNRYWLKKAAERKNNKESGGNGDWWRYQSLFRKA